MSDNSKNSVKSKNNKKFRGAIINWRRVQERLFNISVFAVFALMGLMVWRFSRSNIRINVEPEVVAAFNVPYESIGILQAFAENNNISFAELFAVFNAENNFFPHQHATYDLSNLDSLSLSDFRQSKRRYNVTSLIPYVSMYINLFYEIEVFPVPLDSSIIFNNTWGVEHNLQGKPRHMGIAIIDRTNTRGRVPVVSMTGGTIQQAGWDTNLGYFVRIVTENNTNYVYAHLDSLAQEVVAGHIIEAGFPLGQMGNSGGAQRSFPVHLHLAISPQADFTRDVFWINPYPLLKHLASVGN